MAFRHLGPIIQIAYIVNDLNEGMAHWAERMHVGPFGAFTDIRLHSAEYRGAAVDLRFEAAVAFTGGLMVELIRPLGPSIFDEHLRAGARGIHHLAYATDNFDAAEEELRAAGAIRAQGGHFEDGTRNAYYEMPGADAFIEIGDLSPSLVTLFAGLKAAADTWDGSTPTIDLAALAGRETVG